DDGGQHKAGREARQEAIATKTGNSRICQPGTNSYQAIIATIMRKLMEKSTKATTTAAMGTINLGKYTLQIKCSLLSRLLDASLKALEKKLHGSMPTKTISA